VEKHILIGDDNSFVRKTLRAFLEKEDSWIVVGEAANGKEAVEKAKKLQPDLVVLDLSMPVMNGIQAAHELRRLLSSLPLVMFTNVATANLADLALSAGVSAVVPKSEPTMLVSCIHDLLESAA
jgi:two-component system, chemotaxis family, chemotaxis protein CheY